MPESIVEWKPRPRNKVFIKLSGGRFFTVPVTETLAPGAVLSDEEIETLSRVDQYVRGSEKAIRLLAIRPRTRFEIKTALDGLQLLPAIRNGILEELKEKGLIDDRRFAREFVRARVEVKGLGPHRLRFELNKRGVHEAVIDEVFNDEISGESQEATAWAIIRKRLGDTKPDEKDVRRMSALLRRRGIDYEIINRVSYELLQQSHVDNEFD